ncbi:hypothetical protein OSB04_031651 [Centaurea solstitialis]|uniref:Uncharacterized protein n=1 Tax=Centaurea solstitialis TaxID=347529 RepID=A0AA38SAT1_9ASTR|nr:hypothetical protein OSB04_031651 [Centaurea solstitialis]
MSTFFKRLGKAAPIAFSHAFRGQSQSTSTHFRFPIGAIAAVSGGISYFYYFSEPNLSSGKKQEKIKASSTLLLCILHEVIDATSFGGEDAKNITKD